MQVPLFVAAMVGLLLLGVMPDGAARTVGFGLLAAAYLAANIYFERRAKRLRRERNGPRTTERHA